MAIVHSRTLPAVFTFTILAAFGCKASSSTNPTATLYGQIPEDAVFVINGGNASISVVSQSTDEVAGGIDVLGVQYLHHADLDQAGDRLIVGAPGVDLSEGHGSQAMQGDMKAPMSMVLMLDAHTGKVIHFHRLIGSSHNAIFAPDDSEVWTTEWNGTKGTVVVLAGGDLAPRAQVEVGKMPAEVTFSPDGTRAFVCNSGSGTVSVIDVAAKTVVKEIPVGDTPVGAWPGRDGLMYVDNEASKSISVIDPVALAVTWTYELGFTPGMATIAPTGELWVTDSDAGRVVTFDPASNEPLPLREILVGAGAHAMAFSTDDKRAYVSNQNDDTLSIIDVVTGSVIDTLAVGHQPNGIVVRGI